MLNRDEWPTMATQESWNNIIQGTEWLEETTYKKILLVRDEGGREDLG